MARFISSTIRFDYYLVMAHQAHEYSLLRSFVHSPALGWMMRLMIISVISTNIGTSPSLTTVLIILDLKKMRSKEAVFAIIAQTISEEFTSKIRVGIRDDTGLSGH
jgi:hypothetical protein